VFYDPEALKIKNRPPISPEEILVAFDLPELMVFTEPQKLKDHLLELDYHHKVLLMMSSGNYGGLDWEALKSKLSHY
jgi:UDP-N-acetylmuramate: L-alanyl-gamma-D-glutamyl-meso-diaminopimelate ligase